MSEPFDAFDTWWSEHYSMANLARGAAEEAWKAATERAAICCHTTLDPDTFVMTGPAGIARQIEAAIRRGTP